MTLHLESVRDERGICVRVAGNLERQTYNECVRTVWSEHERTPADVRLDLGGVGRITSVAIAGLWRLAHELAVRRAALLICNVPQPLRAMLSACGLASDVEAGEGAYRFPMGPEAPAALTSTADPSAGGADAAARRQIQELEARLRAIEEGSAARERAALDAQKEAARADADRLEARIADLERQLAAAGSAREQSATEVAAVRERMRRVEEAYERLEGEERTHRRDIAEREARIHQLLKHLRIAHQSFRDMAARLETMLELPQDPNPEAGDRPQGSG